MKNKDANDMPRAASRGDLEGVGTSNEFRTRTTMRNSAMNSNGLVIRKKRGDKDEERREKLMSKPRQCALMVVSR